MRRDPFCVGCGKQLSLRAAESIEQDGGVVTVELVCVCGDTTILELGSEEYLVMAGFRRPAFDDLPRAEQIGRLVQGFRIDLDAVESVEDLLLFWDDQARHQPDTIPREALCG